MPNVNEMIPSKYLKTADVPDPVIVTIVKVAKVNIAKKEAEPEYRWAMKFQEFDKPMILNATNIKIAEKVFRSGDTDNWAGKEIILYTDPNVTFGGELVGGLRFKGQEKAPVKATARPVQTFDEDEIPF